MAWKAWGGRRNDKQGRGEVVGIKVLALRLYVSGDAISRNWNEEGAQVLKGKIIGPGIET